MLTLVTLREDINIRTQAAGPALKRFIAEKRPAISKVVIAPFGSSEGLARSFTDSPWLGEWLDADNY